MERKASTDCDERQSRNNLMCLVNRHRLIESLLCAVAMGLESDIAWAETVAQRASQDIIDAIFAAWDSRNARIQSVRFKWNQERTYTKYWANCHVPSARDEYVTLRFNGSVLMLDGAKMCYHSGEVDASGDSIEFDGSRRIDAVGRVRYGDARRVFHDQRLRYDDGRQRVDPRDPMETAWPRNLRSFTTLFDGQINAHFLPAERGLYPEGYVFRGGENQFTKCLYYSAIVLAYRTKWLNVRSANCSLKSERKVVAGRRSVVLRDSGGLGREFWLDPFRNFVVLRYLENCDVLGARMKSQIDISYVEDKDHGWVPAGWKIVFFDNHGLMEQYAPAIVTEYSINESLPAGEFQLKFPRGTWVFNEQTNERYVVREHGTTRLVTDAELAEGAHYEDLIATSTGSPQEFPKTWSISSAGVSLGLAVIHSFGAAGYLYWRYRRKKRFRALTRSP